MAERWGPFLERFPTPAACAAAPVAEVLRLWTRPRLQPAGAGPAPVRGGGGRAPRRCAARRPRRAARPSRHRARTRPGRCWRSRSSSTTASSTPTPPGSSPAGRAERSRPNEAQPAADAAVPPGEAWAWNQAMLDLGATVCTRRAPRLRGLPGDRRAAPGRGRRSPAPDPADGSAGVSDGPVALRRAATGRAGAGWWRPCGPRRSPPRPSPATMGWPDDPGRADRVAATLVADGLVELRRRAYHLTRLLRLVDEPSTAVVTSSRSATEEVDDQRVDVRRAARAWRKWPASSTTSMREPSEVRNGGAGLGHLEAHAAVGAAVQVQRRLRR